MKRAPARQRRRAGRTNGALRLALSALALLYLAGLWLDGTGLVSRLVPQPGRYFLQVAALFPHAVPSSTDYRAEAWLCSERRWQELDTRPYFRISREHKENRFFRALHFYRQNRPAMQALDRYLLEQRQHHAQDDGLDPSQQVGGFRFLSVRRPIPEPGSAVSRWQRTPLSDIPRAQQHRLYWTRASWRAERCGQPMPTQKEDE